MGFNRLEYKKRVNRAIDHVRENAITRASSARASSAPRWWTMQKTLLAVVR
jgi:hypothetical protein